MENFKNSLLCITHINYSFSTFINQDLMQHKTSIIKMLTTKESFVTILHRRHRCLKKKLKRRRKCTNSKIFDTTYMAITTLKIKQSIGKLDHLMLQTAACGEEGKRAMMCLKIFQWYSRICWRAMKTHSYRLMEKVCKKVK